MLKNMLTYCAILLLATTTFAQKSMTEMTYKVRLSAFEKDFDKAKFDNVKDLGMLTFELAENGFTRVYLGNYLEKRTAQRVMDKVVSRGYKDAYLVRDNYLFEGLNGEELTHTVQFASVKKLNLQKVYDALAADAVGQFMLNDLYVSYSGGYYRLMLGMFAQGDQEKLGQYTQALNNIGFNDLLVRRFRIATPAAAAPAEATAAPTAPATTAAPAETTAAPTAPAETTTTTNVATEMEETKAPTTDTQKDRAGATAIPAEGN